MNRQKALMKKYLSRPENRFCADCKRPSPTWASLNLGVFVCIKCSGCHREIGVHITKIKSVELDLWPSKALTDFAKINNEIANAYWEYDLKNYDFQRLRDNEIRLIEFIRDKYEFKRWTKPHVPDPMSLVIQGRDLVKEFMTNGEALKMYEKSNENETENRSQHFGRQKVEKKGKSFGIVDKSEKKQNANNNIANNNNSNQMNNNNNNNNFNSNINNDQNNQNKPEKGFGFIKRKHNNPDNNNNMQNNTESNSTINTNNNIDLLGFGSEQNDNNTNNLNQMNSGANNSFPLDIFSIGISQTNSNNNMNSYSNMNNNINDDSNINNNLNNISNMNENNIQNNIISNNIAQNQNPNNDSNKPKSGFSFIKKKNMNQNIPINNNNSNNTNNNNNITIPSQSENNINNINDIFNNNINPPQNTINNINNNINTESNNNNTNNNNSNVNKSSTNNNLINIFEDDNHLVDLFNIETPTSDAVLNLSKNLSNIYSKEGEGIVKPNNPNSSNYNVLNMNYPNININNYYPNEQQNKNKVGMMNNNYGMSPMMGYNFQPQPNYMNNNFGFWYGYGMNNMGGQYMGMNMNSGPINPGFNYQAEFYKDNKKEKEKEEPKPILFNNNTFDLNLKKNKEKDDPFKNLVDFK